MINPSVCFVNIKESEMGWFKLFKPGNAAVAKHWGLNNPLQHSLRLELSQSMNVHLHPANHILC